MVLVRVVWDGHDPRLRNSLVWVEYGGMAWLARVTHAFRQYTLERCGRHSTSFGCSGGQASPGVRREPGLDSLVHKNITAVTKAQDLLFL